MSTIIGFSRYASSEGKADQLDEHVGEVVTFTEYDTGTITGTLDRVFYHEDGGWLAVVTIPGGREPQSTGYIYLSDVASVTVGSL